MDTWNAAALRQSFAIAATHAENYAKELSHRIKRDPRQNSPFIRETHDEHLAKWFVYDSFVYSNCVDSRQRFVAAAKRKLAGPAPRGLGSFSEEDFERHWRAQMQDLISRYEEA